MVQESRSLKNFVRKLSSTGVASLAPVENPIASIRAAAATRLIPATRLAAACAVAGLLSGCPARSVREEPSMPPLESTASGQPGQGPQSPNAPQSGAPTQRPPPPQRENHLSPATRSLVTQAHGQMSHGDIDGASSTLDRALRIEPNNPLLWIELGRLRLAESDAHQAEGCGRKALALASGDRSTQRQAGRLLADALRSLQRNQEAHDIESQPYMR